ncbi:MAG: universal stress protein [Thermodesulfobacteriota bacterium]
MNTKPNRILVAVDASENSLRAVAYTGEMAKLTPDLHIEVLSICRQPDPDLFPDPEALRQRMHEQEAELTRFLDQASQLLEKKGVPPASISKRNLCITHPSIAQQILSIQEEGGFGTVAVGRRGVSKAEEFLFGSVSSKIVHYAKNCTVWVVA